MPQRAEALSREADHTYTYADVLAWDESVREYWIVDPEEQTVQVHILDRGRYVTAVYDETDTAPITVLPGCVINLAKVIGPLHRNSPSGFPINVFIRFSYIHEFKISE
jgi:Uma2 family endonuclease